MKNCCNVTEGLLDVVVVGAGPVGLACGISAHRAGLSYRVVDKGCLVNSVYHFPVHMEFFTTPELLEIGGYPFPTSQGKPTRREALEYYRKLAGAEGLAVDLWTRVTGVSGGPGEFLVDAVDRDGERSYRCRRLILATGYYDHPNLLGVPGENLPHVSHYFDEAHPWAGQRVLVVGGKNSSCEAALDLYRHGAQVTLVHRGADLGRSVKYWVRPDMENRLLSGEVRGLFRTVVVEIRPRSVVLAPFDDPSASWEEPFDRVYLLTGYHADPVLLSACGLYPDPATGKVRLDPDTLESLDAPGVHVAGSAGHGRQIGDVFIENGRHDAQRILRHLVEVFQGPGSQGPSSQGTGS